MRIAEFIDFLRQTGAQVREAWGQLSASARVNLVSAGLLAAGIILYVAFFRNIETRYITLADNLTAEQISESVTLLEDQKVPYQLDEAARTIRVPPKDRSRMLLELERNGLPVGRSIPSGFEELFAEPDFMSNQWFNDINYLRAVQGELEKQLSYFEFVEFANVLIREADNEYFVEEQIPSEASVVLKTTRDLSPREGKLIVSMITRAGGANLHAGNITVTTTAGVDIHLPSGSEFASVANDKLEYQNTVERRIEEKIQDKLKRMGIRGEVSVGARISFDQQETLENIVTEGTPLSELETTQDITSTERLPEGAPGALQNVPEAAAGPGGTEMVDNMEETLVNYEPSRKTITTRSDPGDVVRYKVALVVQGDTETVVDEDGNETRAYNGLDERTRLACLGIAQSAVAAEDEEAEAVVEIFDHPFVSASAMAVSAAMETGETSALREGRQRWINVAMLVAGVILALFLVSRALKKSIIHPSEDQVEETVKDIPEATMEDMRRQEVATEISRLSQEDPEAVAALLRSWMSESEE